jgi:hypothetical protein
MFVGMPLTSSNEVWFLPLKRKHRMGKKNEREWLKAEALFLHRNDKFVGAISVSSTNQPNHLLSFVAPVADLTILPVSRLGRSRLTRVCSSFSR